MFSTLGLGGGFGVDLGDVAGHLDVLVVRVVRDFPILTVHRPQLLELFRVVERRVRKQLLVRREERCLLVFQ